MSQHVIIVYRVCRRAVYRFWSLPVRPIVLRGRLAIGIFALLSLPGNLIILSALSYTANDNASIAAEGKLDSFAVERKIRNRRLVQVKDKDKDQRSAIEVHIITVLDDYYKAYVAGDIHLMKKIFINLPEDISDTFSEETAKQEGRHRLITDIQILLLPENKACVSFVEENEYRDKETAQITPTKDVFQKIGIFVNKSNNWRIETLDNTKKTCRDDRQAAH